MLCLSTKFNAQPCNTHTAGNEIRPLCSKVPRLPQNSTREAPKCFLAAESTPCAPKCCVPRNLHMTLQNTAPATQISASGEACRAIPRATNESAALTVARRDKRATFPNTAPAQRNETYCRKSYTGTTKPHVASHATRTLRAFRSSTVPFAAPGPLSIMGTLLLRIRDEKG